MGVAYPGLKDSIRFKVNAQNPQTLDEAYGLVVNFEKEINSKMERKKINRGKDL